MYYKSTNFYNGFNIDRLISYICENEYMYFFNKPNVQCIGLGYKEIRGICTFEKCIKVFVSEKIYYNNLSQNDLIPQTYKNIPIDVVQSGTFQLSSLTERIRPVLGGYSVGPANVNQSGTMGCLVKSNKKDEYYILSCNHVLADINTLPIGTHIVQPGVFDGGKDKEDIIATLHQYIPIKFKSFFSIPENHIDAAIAKIKKKSLVSSIIALYGQPPSGISRPVLGETVYKIGRTTGLTSGSIYAINSTAMQRYEAKTAIFKNQIITSGSMGDIGDSGAILIDYNGDALGMLMSCSADKKYTKYNSIYSILSAFDINIVTGDYKKYI